MNSTVEAGGRSRLTAILLMCGALACFACLDTCAKWLNQSIDPLQTVWLRYVFALALVTIVLNPITTPGLHRTKKPGLQAFRSLLLFLSTAFNFLALRELQLAEAMALNFATPFVVALLAGPMLGEWIGPRRLIAIAVGFLGVLLVARPGFDGLPAAAWWAVGGVIAYALYQIVTRSLAAHDSSQTTMFYSGFAGVVILTPLLPFIDVRQLTMNGWAIAVMMGVFGSFGHWLLILAHRRAPASILSPFMYTQIVWMIALGFLVFGDAPDRYTLIGSCIVIASGLYLLYRERVRGVDLSEPEAKGTSL
ncbi:MAG: DMT family transporter [Beijerinckiaceae bacterium]